jgi:tetratricopeptide (TPR) repeat protein
MTGWLARVALGGALAGALVACSPTGGKAEQGKGEVVAMETYRELIDQGQAQERLGNVEPALQFYDRAIQRSPDKSEGWRRKAVLLASAQRFDESLMVLEAGNKAAPGDDVILGLLITNLREVGRKDEAYVLAQSVLQQESRSIWVLKAAGDTLRDRGEYSKANRLYDRGLDIEPDNTMLLNGKATSAFLEKDFVTAATLYERTAAIRPDDFLAWINLAFVRENLGLKAKACEAYERALAIRANDPAALEGRAGCAPSPAEAEPFIQRLAAVDPAKANEVRQRMWR